MRATTYFSVRPFAWHAIAATLAVIVAPLLVVLALLALDVQLPMLVIALIGMALAVGATALGHTLWNKRVEAAEIAFSDLMLWRWFIRRRAEDTLEEGARLLGLDRSGHPIDEVRITPNEQLEVLKDLTAALESKDPYTHGHSQRVERHAYRTAAAMHLSIHDIEDLRKAAALHDVGKIRVPDRILRKPDQLTIEERVIMEEHSVVGAWMVSSVGNADVIAAVRHHHERFDGLGYPDGVAGTEIPLYSRIIAVADAYDAITSSRPYRSSAGRDDAIVALRESAGKQFDPDIVEVFIAALPARLPITAGVFLILGGAPQRAIRAFASWLKRLGAGSLTPAVGAAGAAVVLGASVFTPNVPSPVAPTPAEAAPAPGGEEEAAPDVDPLPRNEREEEEPEQGSQGQEAGQVRSFRDDGSIVLSDTMTRDAATEDEPLVMPAEPEQTPDPEETPEQEPAPTPFEGPTSTPTPTPSPTTKNRNDGRDGCGSDGNAGHGNDECEGTDATSSEPGAPGKKNGKASKADKSLPAQAEDKPNGRSEDKGKGKPKP